MAAGATALRALIESPAFHELSGDAQHAALASAGSALLRTGREKIAYTYLVRAAQMPQADRHDAQEQLVAARYLHKSADALVVLAKMVRQWPDDWRDGFNGGGDEIADRVLEDGREESAQATLPLLQALYDAHWTYADGELEPSGHWYELAQGLIERGSVNEALRVARRIDDARVLIRMRVDHRFDPLVSADPALFDIERAADREIETLQARSEQYPRSLRVRFALMQALLARQHVGAALALADSIVIDIRSTNFPTRLYSDFDEYYATVLAMRAIVLTHLDRSDEAIEQLTAASRIYEQGRSNVSQTLELAALFCDLERPRDAQAALERIGSNLSPRGVMEKEYIRLDAAVQLGDAAQREKSLRYLREHRSDSLDTYEDSLVSANELDQAARLLIRRLKSRDERGEALESVQNYLEPSFPAREIEMDRRWRTVVNRPDVQREIARVGRMESFTVENDEF